MSTCQYPGCQEEAIYFSAQPRTWLERVADLGGSGYCKVHEFFKIIDRDRYDKARPIERTTMEIMAVEDLVFLRELDEAAKTPTP